MYSHLLGINKQWMQCGDFFFPLIHSLCNQVYRLELIHFHSEEEPAASAETTPCRSALFFRYAPPMPSNGEISFPHCVVFFLFFPPSWEFSTILSVMSLSLKTLQSEAVFFSSSSPSSFLRDIFSDCRGTCCFLEEALMHTTAF